MASYIFNEFFFIFISSLYLILPVLLVYSLVTKRLAVLVFMLSMLGVFSTMMYTYTSVRLEKALCDELQGDFVSNICIKDLKIVDFDKEYLKSPPHRFFNILRK